MALGVVADRLEAAGVEWLLAGSAGRRLLGFAGRPADLDLETTEAGAEAGAAALGLEVAWAREAGRASLRAVGRVAGVPVDLSGDLSVEGPGGRLPADFGVQRTWAEAAEAAGRRVFLAPVEEALARALVSADWTLVGRLAATAPAGWAPRPSYLASRLLAAASAAR